MTLVTLNYHISTTFHAISKINSRSFAFLQKKINIKLVFTSFKIKNYFSCKDSIPNDLKSFLVCKCTCASCSSGNIGETCCHFKTRIEDHIKKDNKSYIFKHLHSTAKCFNSCNSLCFKIIDKANSEFDLKITEALHINWRKLNLNAQQNHLALTFSLQLLSALALLLFFTFLIHLLFSSSLTLIICIFYCLNYTLPLLHLITTHLASHLSVSTIAFIITKLIIGILSCLNYTLLLFNLFITQLAIDFVITM